MRIGCVAELRPRLHIDHQREEMVKPRLSARHLAVDYKTNLPNSFHL